jgi:MFS family permease
VRLFQWDRDFGVFFGTQGISNIGDAAWGVLIPLYVLQLTHNPLQVSAIAIIEAVAFSLLRMPFGALADRLEGRRLMIIADLGRTLLTLVIPVAAGAAWPTPGRRTSSRSPGSSARRWAACSRSPSAPARRWAWTR